MKTLREYIDILESLEQNVDEGLMKSLAIKLLDKKTPQEVANSAVSAINKKAPGTKMHGHPNFSDFKREVHRYVSAADSGSEAVRRSSDDHVKSLFKKYFGEGSQDLEETQQAEADPVARITRLHQELNRR